MNGLLRVLKGLYDVLASYLLAWVLLLALLALAFQLLLGLGVGLCGFASTESFWSWVDRVGPVGALPLRLVVFGLLHGLAIWRLRGPLLRLWLRLERGADSLLARHRRWARRHRRGRVVVGTLFSGAVTLLLVPFVLQPTLVPLSMDGRAWAERGANLLDGAASAALLDSTVGLYRKLHARPRPGQGVTPGQFDATFAGGSGRPLMDRWDDLIWRTVGRDRRGFAQLKAVM